MPNKPRQECPAAFDHALSTFGLEVQALASRSPLFSGARWRVCLLGWIAWSTCLSLSAQTWTITGQVVDGSGIGIPGNDIDLFELDGTEIPLNSDTSDANGFFSASIGEVIDPGEYDIIFQPPLGIAPLQLSSVMINGNIDVGVISLAAGWIVSGQVTDGVIGLVGVGLQICSTTGTQNCLMVHPLSSSTGGALAVTMPPLTGVYDLTFTPAGGSGLVQTIIANQFIGGSLNLGTVPLGPGWTLAGTVLDDFGVAIPGIDLNVYDPVSGQQHFTSADNTDTLGQFSLQLPAGTWDVRIRQVDFTVPEEYVPVELTVALFSDTVLPDQTLQLGSHLTGTVHNELAQPIPLASIDARDPVTGIQHSTASDQTDPSGLFDVLIPEGNWEVIVTPPAGASLVPQVVATLVAPPPASNDLGTVVLPNGFHVFGTVVDSSMSPVESVDLEFIVSTSQLSIETNDDNTDALGAFSVSVVPATYDIQFRPPLGSGLAAVELPSVAVVAALDLATVALPAGLVLSGTVHDSASALVGVAVTLTDGSTGTPAVVFHNITDPSGVYAVTVVPGTYDVTFTPAAGSPLSPLTVNDQVLAADLTLDADLGGGLVPTFIRGNANLQGIFDLADVIFILQGLFSGGPLPCFDAADGNDDGFVDISDAISLLGYLFVNGPPPVAPFPDPGVDPTPDGLGCG